MSIWFMVPVSCLLNGKEHGLGFLNGTGGLSGSNFAVSTILSALAILLAGLVSSGPACKSSLWFRSVAAVLTVGGSGDPDTEL